MKLESGDKVWLKDDYEMHGEVVKVKHEYVIVKVWDSEEGNYEYKDVHKSRIWKEDG